MFGRQYRKSVHKSGGFVKGAPENTTCVLQTFSYTNSEKFTLRMSFASKIPRLAAQIPEKKPLFSLAAGGLSAYCGRILWIFSKYRRTNLGKSYDKEDFFKVTKL